MNFLKSTISTISTSLSSPPCPSTSSATKPGLTCPICLAPFNSTSRIPKVYPCGHSICSECTVKLIQMFPTVHISCPIDRKSFLVNSKASDVPTNFAVLQLVEDFEGEENQEADGCNNNNINNSFLLINSAFLLFFVLSCSCRN